MNFDPFIEVIRQKMQPAGRAMHQAGMLQHLLAGLSDEVTLADLVVGWQMLAQPPSEQEAASITHRREICGELASIAAPFTSEPGHLESTVKAWQKTGQKSADPRLVVMAKTFARERVELRLAASRV